MSEPNANDVRREAFSAAAAAVDSFLERVGDPVPDELSRLGAATWDRFRSELARVVDLNLEMVREAFGLYGSLLGPETFQSEQREDTLMIGPGIPGSVAAAVLWLHNFDEDPVTRVHLVGSRLSSADSDSIDDPGWSFTPSDPSVPARSAVPVLVEVAIPRSADSGFYEGIISATGRQAERIDVRVEVTAGSPVPHDSW